MLPDFAASIDWSRPWFASVRPVAEVVSQEVNWRSAFNDLARQQNLINHQGLPVQFVPQEQLPNGVAYESYISQTGLVPTRENLHDFLNGLIWLTFPAAKRQLNAFQAQQIALLGIGKSRGPARDAGTIFDENAALLVIRDNQEMHSWLAELSQHRWAQTLWQQRERYLQDYEVWSFGHALMEKLLNPYKAITAHAKVMIVQDAFFSLTAVQKCQYLDQRLLLTLQSEGLAALRFTPLPVLGIPYWDENQDADFYADTQVFRPKRLPLTS